MVNIFGSYVEAHDKLYMTNTMESRKHKSIFLGTTGNIQGSLFVFELNTGRILKMRNVTVRPVPYCIIKKFDSWGRHAQNLNSTTDLKFINITKNKYNWYNG